MCDFVDGVGATKKGRREKNETGSLRVPPSPNPGVTVKKSDKTTQKHCVSLKTQTHVVLIRTHSRLRVVNCNRVHTLRPVWPIYALISATSPACARKLQLAFKQTHLPSSVLLQRVIKTLKLHQSSAINSPSPPLSAKLKSSNSSL